MGINEIFTEMVYVRGSLINIDLDGDGVYDGFSFRLRNPPVPLGGKATRIELLVDGKPVDKSKSYIIVDDRTFRLSEVSASNPIVFTPGMHSIFMVITGRGLEEGSHTILLKSWLEGFEEVWVPFQFEDEVKEEEVKIGYSRDEADLSYPIILSNGRSYAVLSRRGDLSANWNWMGVTYDIGGFYLPPSKVIGPVKTSIIIRGNRMDLGELAESFIHGPGYLKVFYRVGGGEVTRRIFLPYSKNYMVDEFIFKGVDECELLVEGVGAPIPYGLLGLTPQSVKVFFQPSINGLLFWSRYTCCYGAIGCDGRRILHVVEGQEDVSEVISPNPHFQIRYKPSRRIRIIVSGGDDVEEILNGFREGRDPYILHRTILHHVNDLNRTTYLETDEPEINQAFNLAKLSLSYLKMRHPELGPGIIAGLPRFPTYWGRDTGWSLPAYLHLGDHEWAREVIENMLRHMREGEIPMIIGGRGFLHTTSYGSTDATLHYPYLILEYVRSSGDLQSLRRWYPRVVEMIRWGESRDLDGDGFLDHSGSMTGLLPIPDTTWMDHIDRQKSAIEVQALWVLALRSASSLAEMMEDHENMERWGEMAEEVRRKMEKQYWNPREDYFYDTIRPDGSMDPTIRPNAAVPLAFRMIGEELAEKALKRIERPDMTTPWGVRTLSSLNPRYDPKAYHDGAVWPLVTGWAAMAEFAYRRAEEGYRYLKMMAGQILREAGMYAELYRGDREEPFNACILQAWSTAMYIRAIFSMLGIMADAPGRTVRIDPRIPKELKIIRVGRLRVGENTLSITINMLEGSVAASSSRRGPTLRIITPKTSKELPPGGKTILPL